jgi:hypothetical protein
MLMVGRAFGSGPMYVAGVPLSAGSPSPTTGPTEFQGSIRTLTTQEKGWMSGETWHKGCPVPMGHLRLLTLSYYNFDGVVSTGRLVINRRVATDVLSVFQKLYDNQFPMWDVDTTDLYPPDQRPDHLRDVSVGFNCRPIGGTTTWSQHAFGLAIDINPVQNPEVTPYTVVPHAGLAYVDRSKNLKGMIHKGDSTVHAFASIGWGWGGVWHSKQDYMHFSLTGG